VTSGRLVLASANPDKAMEIRAIVATSLPGVELRPRPADLPDVVEDGDTLVDNARLKAVAVAEATGEAALADDTGLEVAALDGAPGVYSARFAGERASYAENVDKLLGLLEGGSDRRARFRTVAMVRWPDGREVIAEGVLEGTIASAPRGEGGFGYDPVFVPNGGGGLTYAEMGTDAKNALSHRSRALRELAAKLTASGLLTSP
jgi:XTP/dITP diphosphohydrolase